MTAKGKSYRRSNPRDVLARLIAEHPKAGKRKLKDEFLTAAAFRNWQAAKKRNREALREIRAHRDDGLKPS